MTRRGPFVGVALTILLLIAIVGQSVPTASASPNPTGDERTAASGSPSAVSNFTAAIGRLVVLVAAAGAGLLSLVWARVALSWFSHDSMKKVLAKERARDALIGTLLFVAAVSGLVWALANWVVTGT